MDSKVGILMPVASLPNRFGSGDFGPEAFRFVDDCAKAGFSIWQLLPMNPLGYGNSPYQPFSSYAMDEIYISLDYLAKEYDLGIIPDYRKHFNRIDYPATRKFREEYLRMAFAKFQPTDDYKKWVRKQAWLESYAIFMAFKRANNFVCWNEWPQKMRDYPEEKELDLELYRDEIHYQKFLQYTLSRQWAALKDHANSKGIRIMGDVPFYVGLDSADCWANRSNFLLTKSGHPRFIAGVPPDYFAESGQRWGNPIYDWEHMEEDGFRFWLDRLSYNYTHGMFDIIRLDHFRAFDTYWKIPASCPTAIEGDWIEAPGKKLFELLLKKYPGIEIVAEDLGDMRPEVYELRDQFGFPGMNILSFTFNPERDNHVIPHSLAYTGTHDNETIVSYFEMLDDEDKAKWRKWMKIHGFKGRTVPEQFLDFTVHCGAEMIIVPMMDWLLLGSEATLNHPGTVGSPNWEWRLNNLQKFEERIPAIRKLIRSLK